MGICYDEFSLLLSIAMQYKLFYLFYNFLQHLYSKLIKKKVFFNKFEKSFNTEIAKWQLWARLELIVVNFTSI